MSAFDPKRASAAVLSQINFFEYEPVFHHRVVPVMYARKNCGVSDGGQHVGFALKFAANPRADPGGVRPNGDLASNIRSCGSVRQRPLAATKRTTRNPAHPDICDKPCYGHSDI